MNAVVNAQQAPKSVVVVPQLSFAHYRVLDGMIVSNWTAGVPVGCADYDVSVTVVDRSSVMASMKLTYFLKVRWQYDETSYALDDYGVALFNEFQTLLEHSGFPAYQVETVSIKESAGAGGAGVWSMAHPGCRGYVAEDQWQVVSGVDRPLWIDNALTTRTLFLGMQFDYNKALSPTGQPASVFVAKLQYRGKPYELHIGDVILRHRDGTLVPQFLTPHSAGVIGN